MKTTLSLAFLLAIFQLSAQTTYFIGADGSDMNSGLTSDQAFETINHAINLVSCGDSIYVLGGTYHEKINAYVVCPEDNRIVIQGDIDDRPIIVGDSLQFNKYALSAGGSGYRIRHFEMTSPYPDSCSQSTMVIVGKGDYFDFIDLEVHHSGYDGVKTTLDCDNDDFAVGWRFYDSEIHSNGLGCPSSILNGDGIDFTGCHDCLIHNTSIHDNMGHQLQVKLQAENVIIENSHIQGKNLIQIGLRGNSPQCDLDAFNADSVVFRYNSIVAQGDTSDFVFKLSDVTRLYIENNTIIKDSIDVNAAFICFGGCGSADNWQYEPQWPNSIKNNIFYNHVDNPFYAGAEIVFYDPLEIMEAEVDFSNNLFYDINLEIISPPDNSLSSMVADPLFCNFPDDYELTAESPCIDAGNVLSQNDPDGSINDIGGFYYQYPCSNAILGFNQEVLIDVYPNPSSGLIQVYVDHSLVNRTYEIVDLNGKVLLNSSFESVNNAIDLQHIAKGIYFLRVSAQSQPEPSLATRFVLR